jgi:hypothetical protein
VLLDLLAILFIALSYTALLAVAVICLFAIGDLVVACVDKIAEWFEPTSSNRTQRNQ